MLTITKLKSMHPHTIIEQGVALNNEEGLLMTDNDPDREILWVAVKEGFDQWSIKIGWLTDGLNYIVGFGEVLESESHIRELVKCDSEAFEMYKFTEI